MPKREVTSAPWVPVPARACTGKAPRARQHRAVGRLSAGAPRLHKSCRLRRPQSKGRSCRSGRARRDPRARGGRRHLSERPGWPSGAPISRGSTVSMIAFGGRQGPHRSGSRCRGRPIERREAGREGCLWPNAASQGRPPDGSGGESERSTQNGRAKTLWWWWWWWWWWWQQLRITSGRLPRIWGSILDLPALPDRAYLPHITHPPVERQAPRMAVIAAKNCTPPSTHQNCAVLGAVLANIG